MAISVLKCLNELKTGYFTKCMLSVCLDAALQTHNKNINQAIKDALSYLKPLLRKAICKYYH